MKAYSNGLFFIPPMSIRILLSEQIVCCTSRINATYKLDIYVLNIYVEGGKPHVEDSFQSHKEGTNQLTMVVLPKPRRSAN